MKNWNLSRKIWMLLGCSWLVGLGSSAVLLYQLNDTVKTTESLEAHELHDAQAALELGVDYKTEVQEWKDLLLRGSNPAELKKYTQAFHDRAASVRERATALHDQAATSEAAAGMNDFLQANEILYASYEKALQVVASSGGRSAHEADKIVRGQDRTLVDTLERVTVGLNQVAKTKSAAQNEKAEREALATLAGIAALFAGLGVCSWRVLRAVLGVLRKTAAEMSEGSIQVAAAAGQVASSSQALAQGASEQAATLEEISSTLEEVASMSHRNADNTAAADAMMMETAEQVERSNQALTEMVVSMDAIKASSEKVGRINKTIDEIAFQTNILALNAAVEAARAGEAGMGFAVVANEVRNLAQRAAAAAKDTATLIEEAIGNSNQGTQTLDQVSDAIRGITGSAAKVKNLVDEVNEASKQQTEGISQLNTAVAQLSTVTQFTASSGEESAAASEELNSRASSLREFGHALQALVQGNGVEGRREGASPKPLRRAAPILPPCNEPKGKPRGNQTKPNETGRRRAEAIARKPAGASKPARPAEHDPFPMDSGSLEAGGSGPMEIPLETAGNFKSF